MIVRLFLLSFFVFALVNGQYSPNDKVIVLTKQNFAKEIFLTPKTALVEFYAPWCGHCKRLTPEYIKTATNLDGLVKVAAIDCDQERDLCGAFGIQGFPTIKYFGSELGKKDGHPWKEPEDYQSHRTAAGMVKYALSKLPSFVVHAKKDFELNEKEATAVLFTDKKTTTDLYKALSVHFKGRMKLVQVHSSHTELVEKFGIKKFPTLIVTGGSAKEPVVFTEKLGFHSIEKFLSKYAKPDPYANQQQPPAAEEPPSPPPPSMEKKLYNPTSKEEFEEICTSKRAPCAIAFLDSYEKDRHALLLQELEKVVEKHYKSFKILWVEGPQQPNLYNSLQLGGGFPALAVYSPTRKRVVPYLSGFTADYINEFLDGVLRSSKSKEVQIAEFVKPEPIVVEEDEEDLKDEL